MEAAFNIGDKVKFSEAFFDSKYRRADFENARGVVTGFTKDQCGKTLVNVSFDWTKWGWRNRFLYPIYLTLVESAQWETIGDVPKTSTRVF